ncbi:hypothetical protein D3C75_1122010 [compost metagenome]
MSFFEIGKQSGLHQFPAQKLSCCQTCLRSVVQACDVECRNGAKKAEVGGSFFGSYADRRHVQMTTDDLSDLTEWNTFISGAKQP